MSCEDDKHPFNKLRINPQFILTDSITNIFKRTLRTQKEYKNRSG